MASGDLPYYIISREDRIWAYSNDEFFEADYKLWREGEEAVIQPEHLRMREVARRLVLATKADLGIEVYRASAVGSRYPHIHSSQNGEGVDVRVVGATSETDDLLIIGKEMSRIGDGIRRGLEEIEL